MGGNEVLPPQPDQLRSRFGRYRDITDTHTWSVDVGATVNPDFPTAIDEQILKTAKDPADPGFECPPFHAEEIRNGG
ncbi:hypothetical protein ACLMJK_004493 [Lecanora helva]